MTAGGGSDVGNGVSFTYTGEKLVITCNNGGHPFTLFEAKGMETVTFRGEDFPVGERDALYYEGEDLISFVWNGKRITINPTNTSTL